MGAQVTTYADLPTPCLVVDETVLEQNLTRMAGQARDRGVALRPHAKTHKSPELARRQVAAGARGLTVATLSEAQVFADAGLDDLFVAYPLWLDRHRAALLHGLLDRGVRLALGCDSVEAGSLLARHAPGVDVLVEVDSGHHRSGVRPGQAGAVGRGLAGLGLEVRGVFTFPGHSYAPRARHDAARDEASALSAAAGSLRTQGIGCDVVSGGSTPTLEYADSDALTELRPGVYVFGDAQQWELGACGPEQVALTCLATVVGVRPGAVVLDSGSKALGADRAPWASGAGRLLDHPDARIVQLSEHHAVVAWPDREPSPVRGDLLRVVPNHVCNAVNLADELVVVRGDEVIDRWPVAARGANT